MRFILLIILTAIFLLSGCDKKPEIAHTTLTQHRFQDFKVYHFQFSFTNPLEQPITIKSVEVVNEKGETLDHSPLFYALLKQTNFPLEIFTHDTFFPGYENPFDLKKSSFAFATGTPLETAEIVYHKDYIEGKIAFGDKSMIDREITIKPVDRLMKGKETINPARYLFFTETPYETLQLKVSYQDEKGPKQLLAKFQTQKQ